MYKKLLICLVVTTLGYTSTSYSQDSKDSSKDNSVTISLTPGELSVKKGKEDKKKESRVTMKVGVIDLGINSIRDNSDYSTAAAQTFLQVPDEVRNENLFNLRTGKSWNVNVWPVLGSWKAVDGKKQKVVLGTGVGLQMYNFRFSKPVTYINKVNPEVYLDSTLTITKNKLGLTYLSVPIMLTFKTKASKDLWVVYGVGITGGYRIASWMKQVSTQDGKQKNHDKFNLSDFNSCLTAEFGLDGYFRLFASYQITPLHESVLDQRPLSIGVRFGGI